MLSRQCSVCYSIQFNQILEHMNTARKLFRLFKSLIEYGTMKKLMSDPIKNALPIIARIAFASYWFFDNIAILIKIKFI